MISRRLFLQFVATAGVALLPFRRLGPVLAMAKETAMVNPLYHSMERVAKCCLAWLNPDERHLPTGGYEVAHDTGRWWDAMLRCEAATGLPIPQWAEDAMLDNLRAMTDNPAALLVSTSGHVNLHNIRETMLAYTALVTHRQSDWAREQGRRLVATIAGLLTVDGQINYEQLSALINGTPINQDPLMFPSATEGSWFDSSGTTGRAIEAVVWFSEATGDADAMALAKRLAETHYRTLIDPSGKVRPELLAPDHVGHNHSYCGTLRGLLLYGLASGEQRYVEAVANTYRKGLWGTTISYSGWTPHDLGKLRFPNGLGDPVADHGSCSDVVQLALWLALRAGHTDLLDDVERLLRARLFPSQIEDPSNPRDNGAWGVYGHPFGFGAILDVFAAVLHCLADVSRHVVTTAQDGTIAVNLHFSCDTPDLTVQAQRGDDATTVIVPKRSASLRIRVPGWADREQVRLRTEDVPLPLRWDGAYLAIDAADVVAGRPIVLQHDLPRKETTEVTPVSRFTYRLQWRGDEVVACDPPVPIYSAPVVADDPAPLFEASEGVYVLGAAHVGVSKDEAWIEYPNPHAPSGIGFFCQEKEEELPFSWSLQDIPPGVYTISVWIPLDPNYDRATNAAHRVVHADGATTIDVNLTRNLHTWQALGIFTIDANSRVEVSNRANRHVVVEGIRLAKVVP
jgi:hypothetical protein